MLTPAERTRLRTPDPALLPWLWTGAGDPPAVTLATYESPAADHLVTGWRAEQGARVRTWVKHLWWTEVHLPGEVLLLVATGRDLPARALVLAADYARTLRGPVHPFSKLLHFGRVPVDPGAWVVLLSLVTP